MNGKGKIIDLNFEDKMIKAIISHDLDNYINLKIRQCNIGALMAVAIRGVLSIDNPHLKEHLTRQINSILDCFELTDFINDITLQWEWGPTFSLDDLSSDEIYGMIKRYITQIAESTESSEIKNFFARLNNMMNLLSESVKTGNLDKLRKYAEENFKTSETGYENLSEIINRERPRIFPVSPVMAAPAIPFPEPTITHTQEAGRVQVLLSGRYNNFTCSRPLSPGASDAEYKKEFAKALELSEYGLAKKENRDEVWYDFQMLLNEFTFLKSFQEDFNKKAGMELTESEKAARERFNQISKMLDSVIYPEFWEDRFIRDKGETPLEGDVAEANQEESDGEDDGDYPDDYEF